MANRLYDKGRELFLLGDLEWDTATISLLLIDTESGGAPIDFTDDFKDDVSAGIVADLTGDTVPALINKTHAAGLADASDATFDAVQGNDVKQLIIYKETGVTTTSPLIVSIDTATGFTLTPNTGDVTVVWNSAGIFRL